MFRNFERNIISRRVIFGLKIIAIILVVMTTAKAFFRDDCLPYYTIKEYSYQNDFSQDQVRKCGGTGLTQSFIARGNIITNISLYFAGTGTGEISIDLLDTDGKSIHSAVVDTADAAADAWKKIAFDCNVQRGHEYCLEINSESGLDSILIDVGDKPETFTSCKSGQEDVEGCLVFGINQTYRYMTVASKLELAFGMIMVAFMTAMLCYVIFNVEKLISSFPAEGKKHGVLYALYFATTYVFLFNPIDSLRTRAVSFDRVFGDGLNANVDVERRINNFYFWFVCFAIAFLLTYILVNFLKTKEVSEEQKKVVVFLDQFMVLANVNLLLRCITYFSDNSKNDTVFYYSTALINLVIILCMLYVFTGIGNKIHSHTFLKIELVAYAIGFPISIIMQKEWEAGKLLFGVQMVCMFTLLFMAVCFTHKTNFRGKAWGIITPMTMVASLVPFLTSFYIELINILNQYGVFIANLRKYYVIFLVFCLLLLLGGLLILPMKGIRFIRWKTFSFLFLVIGITSLGCQIPLENTYNAHMFETANSSILISDFLNFGDIPIVQHYGGHMMAGVWEGILYGILNGDYEGAIFSPYAGYNSVMLAVLFFFLVREIWNEELAVFVTLFFPFSGSWRAYGLGMLMCLAVWGYLKKNTWPRAIMVWGAFVWCTLYRLDLGFSIGIACMIALLIYVVIKKNWYAARQLGITLVAWGGVLGLLLWSVICLAKGINPINRLIEFIMISLSNQNWSYPGIGDAGTTLFAWCYIIIPFFVVTCMCYVLFSKHFREKVDDAIWVALLIFGFSYFTNFPRAVVRHSLAEMNTAIVLWDAYLFIAIFISTYKNKKQLFLPVFAALFLMNTALRTTGNFTESTIADGASAYLGDFTSTWTVDRFAGEDLLSDAEEPKTYWKKIQEKGEPVKRVVWNSALESTISKYKVIMDTLLEPDETFVDLTDNTFLYSAINRKDPVYVSQSPGQLSGEFTQERFVEEIEDVPIVLMPVGRNVYLPDAYHNYKVYEYVNQNYVPLCKYSSIYAIWCLPERYNEFKEKCQALEESRLWQVENASTELKYNNCELELDDETDDITFTSTGKDSFISEMQNAFDISEYNNQILRISIDYISSDEGRMQAHYTTEKGENYSDEKVVSADIKKEGTAIFDIPISEFSRIRLDIPEESSVTVKSLRLSKPIEDIDFGYDEPAKTTNQNGDVLLTYVNGIHNYSIGYLPRIWADYDEASCNEVYTECDKTDDGSFVFDRSDIRSSDNGNYVLLSATYDGNDNGANYETDDETSNGLLKLGEYQEGKFIEKYQCQFTMEEGTHDYIFRVSCDYNWYHGTINSIRLQGDDRIHVESIKILEGD